jgi:hypothetical protein
LGVVRVVTKATGTATQTPIHVVSFFQRKVVVMGQQQQQQQSVSLLTQRLKTLRTTGMHLKRKRTCQTTLPSK